MSTDNEKTSAQNAENAESAKNAQPEQPETQQEKTQSPVKEEAKEKEDKKDRKAAKKEAKGKELEEQLQQVQNDLLNQKQQYLRVLAEYDNYRKRSDREKAGVYSDATAAAVSALLPTADNLERALAQKDCTAQQMADGVKMVLKGLEDAFTKLGVTAMGEVGEAFDPLRHNAVSHIDDDSLGENVISAVYQKGYMLSDKVVRHAMVQVAN